MIVTALGASGLAAMPASAAPTPKPPSTISFTSATAQGVEGDGSICVDVERSVTKGKAPSATVSTTGGTATPAVDYTAVTSTVTFSRQSSTTTVCVPVLVDDVVGESDETVTLTLTTSTRGWSVGTIGAATLTIHEMATVAAPTGLGAELVAGTADVAYVHLTWTAPAEGAASYSILSSTTSGGPYVALGSTTSTTFDNTPAPTVDTYYVVRAVNAEGAPSANSDEALGAGYVPGTGLFWANFSNGTIMAADPDGSGVNAVVSGIQTAIGVAVDASHLYWTDYAAGTITAANLDGSGAVTLVSGLNRPYGLAVDASHIYWADISDGTISVADLDGANVSVLVTGENSPSSVAVDGTHLYWTNWNSPGGILRRAGLDGSAKVDLVVGQDYPFAVAVDANHVYWVNVGDNEASTGAVQRADLDGTAVTTIASGQAHPDGIALDDTHVYWANANTGSIVRSDLDGSSPTNLVTGQARPAGVAVSR